MTMAAEQAFFVAFRGAASTMVVSTRILRPSTTPLSLAMATIVS